MKNKNYKKHFPIKSLSYINIAKLTLIFLLFNTIANAQDTTKTKKHLLERIVNLTTIETKRHNVSFYPMATYSQRDGLSGGILSIWSIKPRQKKNGKKQKITTPTILTPSFMMSIKKMIEAELVADVFLKNMMIRIKTKYLFLPDKFFGIGNDTKKKPYSFFNMNKFLFESDMVMNINEYWLTGVRIDVNYNALSKKTGTLLNDSVCGYKGGWTNGIGPIFIFDNRNNKIYPSKGWYVSLSATLYGKLLKSHYSFIKSALDIRHYISLKSKKSIIALQGFLSSTNGDIPFFKLPFIGDKRRLRGFSHPYLYMDRNAWFAQAEWRRHIAWRIGGVLFAGVGKVSNSFLHKPFNNLHFVGGGGLRFNVFSDINLRIDTGISDNGNLGIFFTIREAF